MFRELVVRKRISFEVFRLAANHGTLKSLKSLLYCYDFEGFIL